MLGLIVTIVVLALLLGCAWGVMRVFRKVTSTPWIAGVVITIQAGTIVSLLWGGGGADEHVSGRAGAPTESSARWLAALGVTRD